jgi:uncharacterized protein YkwD
MEEKIMVRFLALLSFLFLIYFSWPIIDKQLGNTDIEKTIDQIQFEMHDIKPEVVAIITNLYNEVRQLGNQLGVQLEETPSTQQKKPLDKGKKAELRVPIEQVFSINNVEIGNPKEEIEQNIGAAKRSSLNEYGTNWYSYHDNYRNFFMIMYDQNNNAAGLYTNQDLIASSNGIKIGSTKETVRTKLGAPLTKVEKGMLTYQLQENSDYDLFLLDDNYVTIFYDKHVNNTVTAMQLISNDVEKTKIEYYTKASQALKEGFEFQLFDITNASRVNHQLSILSWDQHVRETARKHSTDMAVNQYFNHTNLEGQSPFDRMKEDDVSFHLAGENLAYGQFSSIFAHEGLMNSLGHRENILHKDYENLGVGVAFNDESQPYYTQNFFAK